MQLKLTASLQPSETSVVFINFEKQNAQAFHEEMAKRKIHIRGTYLDYSHWSRMSYGKLYDVQQYAVAMLKALARSTRCK